MSATTTRKRGAGASENDSKSVKDHGVGIEGKVIPPRDELQELMDSSVHSSLLGVGALVGGRRLRPITMATITHLKELNSPLINGIALDEIQNILLECCIFVCIQSVPLEEATDLVYGDRKALVKAALAFADNVPAHETKSVIDATVGSLKDAVSTQVKAKSKSSDTPSAEMGN
jgi:hypothetical protein